MQQIKGDESAVMLKIGEDSELPQYEKAAEFVRLLHATCTAEMIARRGEFHWYQKNHI